MGLLLLLVELVRIIWKTCQSNLKKMEATKFFSNKINVAYVILRAHTLGQAENLDILPQQLNSHSLLSFWHNSVPPFLLNSSGPMPLEIFTIWQMYYSKTHLFIASSKRSCRGQRMPLTLNSSIWWFQWSPTQFNFIEMN